MAHTNKRLFEGALSTTLTTTLVTAAKKTLVMSISIANKNTTTPRDVTIKLGASGGTAYLSAVSIPPKQTLQLYPHHVLENTETIKGGQDAGTDVDVVISGVEID
jgi:hypothetical protein